jgi:release factor glutamine methyltransferase
MPFNPSAIQLADVVTILRTAGSVFAEDEAQLLASAAESPDELDALVARRASGLPVEQVVGWADFCGLQVTVGPGVFVPRRRSEFLVRLATDLGQDLARQAAAGAGVGAGGARCVVIDMCCGSGAVGVALATQLGGAELHAVDVDPVAVACARQNVRGAGRVYEGDLYEPLPAEIRGRADLLVANAPYVPTAEIALMPAEARLHEPRVALDGGPDGVEIHRRVASEAPQWLSPRGFLLIETSERQAPLTAEAVSRSGLAAEVVMDEDWSAAAVIGSRRG